MLEKFITGFIGNNCIGNTSTTTIRLNGNLLSRLCRDCELNLVKIRPLLARRSLERLHGRKVGIGLDGFDIFHSNIIETHEQGKFMNGHILQHAFGISFKALSQRFRSVFIRIVGNKGNMRTRMCRGKLATLFDVLCHIFIISHENRHSGIVCFLFHRLEFGNSRSTWFFQVNGGTSCRNGLSQQFRIVRRASRHECHSLFAFRDGWEFLEGLVKFHSKVVHRFLLKFSKFRSSRATGAGTHEPRFHDVAQDGRRTLASQELNGMIPSHSTKRGTASNEDHLALIIRNRGSHDD
mmetsp:Transcript_13783/g.24955  ORF Transcript_13783/g.24955 Transcript_13783/m.24955 type:complete len:294 (-) Transcript_13783:58-939(-)